jgi:hypothetical protein
MSSTKPLNSVSSWTIRGSATKVPRPRRISTNPRATRFSTALRTVVRLTAKRAISPSSGGNRSPAARAPPAMSAASAASTCWYSGAPPSIESPWARVTIDIMTSRRHDVKTISIVQPPI